MPATLLRDPRRLLPERCRWCGWGPQPCGIKAGRQHVLIPTALGRVYAMGQNESGECGMGDGFNYIKKPAPIQFEHGRSITAIACGKLYVFLLLHRLTNHRHSVTPLGTGHLPEVNDSIRSDDIQFVLGACDIWKYPLTS